MYRIRLHGRGGQGIKTAGRMLGTAFFAEGLEVQDAPRYGAERRGAPIFATVRASRHPIHERGVIPKPDLTVVADDTWHALEIIRAEWPDGLPTTGIPYVIVNGTIVVKDSKVLKGVYPGKAVRLPVIE